MDQDKEFEFMPEDDGTLPIESAVYQAIGAASMAWSENPTGEFDSAFAKLVGDELIMYIRARERYYRAKAK